MPFIEAPTTFYLGRQFDPRTHRLTDDVVYYDSRDLTTHAVVVGMTGSGKTGLCINLLEEAILDNIPAIIIDPKGDITNLLLTFPDLRPQDFQPWVNVDTARRAGMDVATYAADVAHRWREGLQSWGIVQDRLRWLRLAAQYSIYTPGSDSGLPVSILASLKAPRDGWNGNEEAIRERINGTVTALLALIGMNAEPVKDKEHVLISNIFENAWRQGIDLTLEDIILQVQRPPFEKLGVFEVNDYISERDRGKLAMELNNIIAAPSFQSWTQGESLDIHNLLYQPNGRPKVSIFYIAHLSEPERQFIITLLAENMLGWMRTLSGTTSLRALFYIDEMFGYFPPYPKNPPTKEPLLRLLKQARAFGLGLILATQNPGDLDYKGLNNAGTWFIGRLQTSNDRKRVMSGLESMATAENDLNINDVERLIADIEPRVFLMHNVHDTGGPIMVHTRWAMSYLSGPLTRQQVGILMQEQRQDLMNNIQAQAVNAYPQNQSVALPQQGNGVPMPPSLPGMSIQPVNHAPATLSQRDSQPIVVNGAALPPGYLSNRPPVPSIVDEYFLPHVLTVDQAIAEWQRRTHVAAQTSSGAVLAYLPVLLAQAAVRYQDRKANIFTARIYAYQIPDLSRTGLIHWENYTSTPVESRRLAHEPFGPAIFAEPAAGLTESKRMTTLKKELVDMLYTTARLIVPYNPTLKVYGDPGTGDNGFMSQSTQVARENRDAEIDKVTAQFEKVFDKLADQRERKVRELAAEQKELADRRREETFTKGEALLSLLRGRTTYTLSRTSRARRYTRQTEEDLTESQQVIQELDREMDELERRFEGELRAVNEKWAQVANDTQDYAITPYKKDIHVELFGVGWLPHWFIVMNNQPLLLPVY